jgi:hypothetical protein
LSLRQVAAEPSQGGCGLQDQGEINTADADLAVGFPVELPSEMKVDPYSVYHPKEHQ